MDSSHPKAKHLRFKPFSLFERLRAIYGKDIAKGKQSQTPRDVQEEVDREMEIEDLTTDDESQNTHPLAPTGEAFSSRRRGLRNENAIVIREFSDKLVDSLDRGNEYLRDFTKVMENSFSSETRLFQDMRNVSDVLQTMNLEAVELFRAQRMILRSTSDVKSIMVVHVKAKVGKANKSMWDNCCQVNLEYLGRVVFNREDSGSIDTVGKLCFFHTPASAQGKGKTNTYDKAEKTCCHMTERLAIYICIAIHIE
ncbi:hypothetical protein ACFE04_018761 [Oxalis oulophora]